MAQNAYCGECASRVTLTAAGECPSGHPRSALRDVCDGAVTPQASAGTSVRGTAPNDQPGGFSRHTGLVEDMIGKAIVWIPIGVVLVIALWSGYAASAAMGMSPAAAWASSIGSLVFTIALLAFWVWRRRQKNR